MDGRGLDFYKMLERGFFGMSMQEYIDATFREQYGAPTARDFEYDPVQDDFTYEFLEAELGIAPLATYMDIDSHATPSGYDTAQKYSGKIVPFKRMEVFSRDDMRRFMLAQSNFGKLSANMTQALNEIVFNTFDSLLQSNQSLIAFNRDQAVSTGKYIITDTNNPGSPLAGKLTFDYRVPAGNYLKCGFYLAGSGQKWWDYSAGVISNINSSADPIKDLIEMYMYATDTLRKTVGAFEMSKLVWHNFWNHPSVVKQVLNASFNVPGDGAGAMTYMMNMITPELVQNYLTARGLPPIIVTDNKYQTKVYDADKRKMVVNNLDGFSSQYVALRPASDYGSIKTAAPLPGQLGNPKEVVFNSRTLITREYDPKEKIHWTESEESSLAILTKPSHMFYIEPGVAKT